MPDWDTMFRAAAICPLLACVACVSAPGPSTGGASVADSLLFREAAREVGLVFEHFADASDKYRLPEIMGSGVALLDFDGDGDLDVYLLQGGPLETDAATGRPEYRAKGLPGNRLFENKVVPSGELLFTDVTQSAGLAFGGAAMGVAVGDYDGDRAPDLYVTALGPNALYRNAGSGRFELVDGPQDERWSGSATFVDYDQDGDLDLFFTNYVDFSARNNKECFSPSGARDYCNPTVYNPVPDRLFRNDAGRFADVSAMAGLGAAFGNGLGVTTADLNHDGRPDIYVANDGTENQLWINQGDGRFKNTSLMAGAAVNADGRAEAGMGVLAADFDGDADDDLLLTHNTLETNTLYLNNGRGLFSDATNLYGLGIDSLPFTGFGLAWNDFDHDGRLDAFIANGAVTVMESLRGEPHPFVQDNQYFRGLAKGFRAVEGRSVWGRLAPLASRGLATGDIDLDGDLDVVVSNNNGPARLYLNRTGGSRSIRIRLESTAANTQGLGARVGLHLSDGTSAWRRLHSDGSYFSASEAAVHFALREGAEVRSVEVRWPNGGAEMFPAVAAGRTATLVRGEGSANLD